MIKLLICRPNPGSLSETSFGGLPVKGKDENFLWPTCNFCDGSMQFLVKLATDQSLLQIFMCQNKPGVCNEWDANAGGNKVVITLAKGLEQVQPPDTGESTPKTSYGGIVMEYDSDDYDDARIRWAEQHSLPPGQVLGQVLGSPSWLQGDETPDCDICQKPMRFVAQLEQGPDGETEMNFGGGCAYLFDCTCESSAKFLWQC